MEIQDISTGRSQGEMLEVDDKLQRSMYNSIDQQQLEHLGVPKSNVINMPRVSDAIQPKRPDLTRMQSQMRASDIAFLQNIDKEGITIHRRETVNKKI